MYSLITDRIQQLMQYCKALKSNGAEQSSSSFYYSIVPLSKEAEVAKSVEPS